MLGEPRLHRVAGVPRCCRQPHRHRVLGGASFHQPEDQFDRQHCLARPGRAGDHQPPGVQRPVVAHHLLQVPERACELRVVRRRWPKREVQVDRAVVPPKQLPASDPFAIADRQDQPVGGVGHVGFLPAQRPQRQVPTPPPDCERNQRDDHADRVHITDLRMRQRPRSKHCCDDQREHAERSKGDALAPPWLGHGAHQPDRPRCATTIRRPTRPASPFPATGPTPGDQLPAVHAASGPQATPAASPGHIRPE